jgi:hypothetical protein
MENSQFIEIGQSCGERVWDCEAGWGGRHTRDAGGGNSRRDPLVESVAWGGLCTNRESARQHKYVSE